jgi:hypothetical protein
LSLLRLIIWGLIFYIVTKVVRSVSQILRSQTNKEPLRQPKQNVESKLSIDKKDIIEAEFEEVKSNKDSKQ